MFAFVQNLGLPELLIILTIVIVLFGARRLPMLGRQLGGGMREFKDAITDSSGRHDETGEPAREEDPRDVRARDARTRDERDGAKRRDSDATDGEVVG